MFGRKEGRKEGTKEGRKGGRKEGRKEGRKASIECHFIRAQSLPLTTHAIDNTLICTGDHTLVVLF